MSLKNNFETLNNDVCIIIPTFNSWKITAETIDKLLKQTSKDFDIVVVDAGSNDYIYLKKLYENNKRIVILHSPKDLGSAGSFWLGLKYAYEEGYKIFILSDNDAVPLSENLIEELIKEIKSNSNQVVAPYEEGWIIYENQHNKKLKVNARPFHFLTLSRDIVKKIGFPSPEFFIWHDDGEYCERIRAHFPIYVLTYLKYSHLFPPSTQHYFYSKRYQYNFRNQILMYLKRWDKSNPTSMLKGLVRLLFKMFFLNISIFGYCFFVREKKEYIKNSLKSILLACLKRFGKLEESSRNIVIYKFIGEEISENDVYIIKYDLILIPNFASSVANLDNLKYRKKVSISSKLFSNLSAIKYGLYFLKFYFLEPIFNFNKTILALEFEAPNIVTAKEVVIYDIITKRFLKSKVNNILAILYYFLCYYIFTPILSLLFTLIAVYYEIKNPYLKALKNWFDNELLNCYYIVIKQRNVDKKHIDAQDFIYLKDSIY